MNRRRLRLGPATPTATRKQPSRQASKSRRVDMGSTSPGAVGVPTEAAVDHPLVAALAVVMAVVTAALGFGCSAAEEGADSATGGASGPGGVVLSGVDTGSIGGRHPTSLFGVPGAAARAEIRRVIDGDTVVAVFEGGRSENVRLIGIDTPEKPGGLLPAECYGAEATAFTNALLAPGTSVLLTGGEEARDVYGRLLAYITRAADGLFVNMALVREGYAVAMSIPPNNGYKAHFAAAEAVARGESLGLWAACGGANTPLAE